MGAFASAFLHAFSHAFPTDGSGGGGEPAPGDGSFTADDRAILIALAAAVAQINARIITGVVTIQSPVNESGDTIRIVRGDDYAASEGRSLDFTSNGWPVLDGAVLFKLGATARVSAQITAARAVRVELIQSHTSSLASGTYRWELEATQANAHIVTLCFGNLILMNDL